MKKRIILEVCLLFVFCWLIACNIIWWQSVASTINDIDYLQSINDIETVTYLKESLNLGLTYAVFSLIAAIVTLSSIIIIVVDSPYFKPLLEKLEAKKNARKTAKTEKAEITKQKRIEQLENELNELKKDE